MIRFLSAGESHGKCLTGILEGLPRGLGIDIGFINFELHRRQLGYGRGDRMKIESDHVEITAGVRHGISLGSPIAFQIHNSDWDQWRIPMSIDQPPKGSDVRPLTRPRPGHADLAGSLKFQTYDARDILERASARETAVRVAAGAFCRLLLARFGIKIGSHVLSIGGEKAAESIANPSADKIFAVDPESPVRCADPEAEKRMMARIDKSKKDGDTLGGIVEVIATGVPPGLGSHIQWDRKLDGRIALALMSIPSVKAVEIGCGVSIAGASGSSVHDEIFYDSAAGQFYRNSNSAGGIEGGVSNGADVRARVYVKPIPTLQKPLKSVDLKSKEAFCAAFERSDVCVVPAAGVVAEAMLGMILADAFIEKFGGDSIKEIEGNHNHFIQLLKEY